MTFSLNTMRRKTSIIRTFFNMKIMGRNWQSFGWSCARKFGYIRRFISSSNSCGGVSVYLRFTSEEKSEQSEQSQWVAPMAKLHGFEPIWQWGAMRTVRNQAVLDKQPPSVLPQAELIYAATPISVSFCIYISQAFQNLKLSLCVQNEANWA